MKKLKTNKQMKHFYKFLAIAVIFSITLMGCSEDDTIPKVEEEDLFPQAVTAINGLYLLNQGNMNTNKASLDFYNYASGKYQRNIF